MAARRAARPTNPTNEARLPRLLALVPYLQARPGIGVEQAAADFGVTAEQLRKDLTLLWMCGLPGHGPGELIDLSFEGESVSVVFDAGMSRPLRLTTEEALALVVALRTLAETPGLADSDAVQRALAKVESAAGGAVPDETVAVAIERSEHYRAVLQRAVDERRALRLSYYSASRDERSERVVDPIRLVTSDGQTYLDAWCRRAEGLRMFRLDRIDDVQLLDEPSAVPESVEPRDLDEGVYQPSPEHLLVDLRLGAAYAWVADYYAIEDARPDTENGDSDATVISLRVSDPAWVRALVLGSAGQVEVLAPGWLADDVRAEASRALAAYQPT
ncbi:helix-turn-helix transcriptional regulator [Jatrophihabitans fulvus]